MVLADYGYQRGLDGLGVGGGALIDSVRKGENVTGIHVREQEEESR